MNDDFLFFTLMPSFSITDRSQTRIWRSLEAAARHVLQQPGVRPWMREQGIDHLSIEVIQDEYRQRPLTVKVGSGWAGNMATVKVYRESWIEAPLTDAHSRAWVGLVLNEALNALSEQRDFPSNVRVLVAAVTPFPFLRLEVRGAVAAPGKSMSPTANSDAWLRAARVACDAVNDDLRTAGLTSEVGPELELVLASSTARRASPPQFSHEPIPAPAADFVALLPNERVEHVLNALSHQLVARSGCDPNDLEALSGRVEERLRLNSWVFELSSEWLPSPSGARQARWRFRTDTSGEGQLKIEAHSTTQHADTATSWSPAGPTARSITTMAEDAFIWQSDDAIEFARPHEMNRRQPPVRLEFE